jgi:hypothetical protein
MHIGFRAVRSYGKVLMCQVSFLGCWCVEFTPARSTQEKEANYCKLDDKGRPVMDSPHTCAMVLVLKYLDLDSKTIVSREKIASGLRSMGYRLQDSELDRLCKAIGGNSDTMSRAAIIASQIDWRYMQRFQKERWLALARRAFDTIDVNQSGSVSLEDMIQAMQVCLPLACDIRC